jgi:hypothetical protein
MPGPGASADARHAHRTRGLCRRMVLMRARGAREPPGTPGLVTALAWGFTAVTTGTAMVHHWLTPRM